MKYAFASVVAVAILAAAGTSAADEAALAKFATVTNFLTCPQNVRNDMRVAVKKAAAENDAATLGALLDMLAKNGGAKLEPATFDIWNDAAGAMVGAALELRKKKPEEQKELMAGFREGGSTFGLWQGADVLEKAPDQAMLQAACELLTKKMPETGITPMLRFRRDKSLYDLARRIGVPVAEQNAAIGKVRQLALSVKPATQDDTNAVAQAINSSLFHYLEINDGAAYAALAREYQDKCRDFLESRNDYGAMIAREAAGYHRAVQTDAYRAAADRLAKLPVDKKFFTAMEAFRAAMIDRRPGGEVPGAVDEILRVAKPLIDRRKALFGGEELMNVAGFMLSLARSKNDIPAMITAYGEMTEAYEAALKRWEDENAREKAAREAEKAAREKGEKIDKPFQRDWTIRRPYDMPGRDRWWYVQALQNAGFFAETIPSLEKNLNPKNPNGYLDLMRAYMMAGRKADVAKLNKELQGTNTTANADQKFSAAAYAVIAEAKNPADLVGRLKGLRALSDSGCKDGATQVEKDQRFFLKIRSVSRMLFGIDSTEAAVPNLKAVQAMTYDMLWPEEKVQYTVKYLPDAPSSADGALRTDVFSKLPVENRMAKYNVYNWFDKTPETARVKSAEKPRLNADVPGKEASIVAAYDNNGLHIYARFNDPDAWKARDGIAGGIGIEYSVMPGEDAPWHWNMANSAEKSKDWGVVWDSPRKGFKVGMEYFKEDFCIAEKCQVFHLFFPWSAFPYQLPKNGDTWRFALIGGWAGQFGALGGGAVHELGRAMQMKFEIPGDVQPKLRLALLRQAAKDYKAVRGKFENADFWVDPHLGDPEFHAQVAAPFMKELDGVAKQVAETELNPGQVDQLLSRYLFDLSDFRLALDAKRADWLKAKFFAE